MQEKKENKERPFSQKFGEKELRKLKAKRSGRKTTWFGFGMFGLIGWSVAIPTLLGAVLGLWLDRHEQGKRSWTLVFLISGLVIGCFNAWYWVEKENKEIQKEKEDKNE